MSQQHRIAHIDSIRGIAALLVLYLHVSELFITIPAVKAHGTLLYDIGYQLNFGRLGVVTFFAISGFVICPSLKGGLYAGARKFLISRFFRLYPAFWVAILLSLLVKFVWRGRDIDWTQVLGNIPMLYSYFGVQPIMGLFWTLEVELVFYFLCLALFLCGWLHKPIMLFLIGLALMGVSQWLMFRPDIRTYVSETFNPHWVQMPLHLAIMLWGGLFRMWYDDRQRAVSLLGHRIPIVFLVVALLCVILLRPAVLTVELALQGKYHIIRQFLPYFLGLGLFIVGALYVKLNGRFFVWLGAISYSLYLLHPVAFRTVFNLMKTDSQMWGSMHLGVYLLGCTVLSILLAGLVYYCVEKPAIRLGRYLQAR